MTTAKTNNRNTPMWEIEHVELLSRLHGIRALAIVECAIEVHEHGKSLLIYFGIYDFVEGRIRDHDQRNGDSSLKSSSTSLCLVLAPTSILTSSRLCRK